MMRPSIRFESFTLDLERLYLRGPSGRVELRRKSFDVLRYLVEHANRIVTKEELLKAVWPNVTVGDESLTKCISEIRRATGDESQRIIKTVPRRGYLIDVPVSASDVIAETDPVAASAAPGTPTPSRPLPDRPSIAVLPFANMCGDPDQQYFADGTVEDIITELSRFSDLFVIARNSSFQYKGKSVDVRQVGRDLGVRHVLEGSIRRTGNRVRISAQLIDAVTGSHRWAERYDRKLEEIYAVQDEVVRTIVAILAAQVKKAEIERILLKAPARWQAYDYYMRGTALLNSYWSSLKTEDLYKAQRLFEQSLAIEATYARAYAMLSATYIIAWIIPIDGDCRNPDFLDRAHQMARKGVQFDPSSPQTHGALGMALACKGQHEASIAAFEKAIELNPNYSDPQFALSLVGAGESTRAIEVIKAHMRLDPFYLPFVPLWSGIAHYLRHRYLEALPLLRESVSRSPDFLYAHAWLAACCAQLGQSEEARVEAAEVLRIAANYTIDGTARRLAEPFIKSPVDAEHYFDGLRRAGLPEN